MLAQIRVSSIPIQVKIDRAMNLDMDTPRVQYAVDLLEGRDDFAMNYITAFRDGELD